MFRDDSAIQKWHDRQPGTKDKCPRLGKKYPNFVFSLTFCLRGLPSVGREDTPQTEPTQTVPLFLAEARVPGTKCVPLNQGFQEQTNHGAPHDYMDNIALITKRSEEHTSELQSLMRL